MDRTVPLLLILCGVPMAPVGFADLAPAQQAEFVPLFNGTDLTGWEGDFRFWTVKNGELVGKSTAENPLEKSTYLFWKGEAANFELRFEYLIIGGNSGVQYRSLPLPGGDVAGYQADMETGPNHSGILYESNGRGIMAPRGSHFEILEDDSRLEKPSLGSAEQLQSAVRHEEWNDYRVVANGPHLIHEINGVRMIDVVDRSNKHSRGRGTFALQLHVGPPMEVRYKNLQIKVLQGQGKGDEPEWIWGPEPPIENEGRYFAFPFELEGNAKVSGGLFAADNSFELFVDGKSLAKGKNWATPTAIPSGMELSAGKHMLAVHATNEGGPAGLLGYLSIQSAADQGLLITTHHSWQSWSEMPDGWPTLSIPLPSSGVASKSFGPSSANSGPWGNVFRKSEAPDPANFELPQGFVCERLYSAQPGDGSWASMTFADDGRLFVSPQSGPILMFQPGPELLNGQPAQPSYINDLRGVHVKHLEAPKKLDFPVESAQGMEWAFDSLYINVTGNDDANGGLHRLQDLNRDGVLDTHKQLARYGPPSEHGAHGIRLGPDGWLYLVHGNYTKAPKNLQNQSLLAPDHPFTNWAEDTLLPRIWDPRGHAHGIFAPGALLLRTNADASQWTRVAGGMRNPYDIAISDDGEIFTYDADMEWDLGMPWYRPPRVLHLTPGAEFGWRAGSAKWPSAYPDSLPPISNTDLSSPTGVELGSGSRFPAEYQQALFLGDWSWGRITVTQLEAEGASYTGKVVPFLQGRGLTVTDMEFGPDGWLWFIIGGRGTQSGLYRIRHLQAGERQPLKVPPLLAQRRQIEDWMPSTGAKQSKPTSDGSLSLDDIRKTLTHPDRHLRTAARLAFERALGDTNNEAFESVFQSEELHHDSAFLQALAWVRTNPGLACAELPARLLQTEELHFLDNQKLSKQYLMLRLIMLMHSRSEAVRPALSALRRPLSEQFPLTDPTANRMLAEILVVLEAENLPSRFLQLMNAPAGQEQQLFYGTLLRLVAKGWTTDLHTRYFLWLQNTASFQGGASLKGFLDVMKKETREKMNDADWKTVSSALEKAKPNEGAPIPAQASARSFQRDWKLNEALEAAANNRDQADASRGANLFSQAICIQCHRFDGKGGYLGPDLTGVGRRFLPKDILEAIIDPMKVTSDQYANLAMPAGLLQTFTSQEIADLLVFLENGRWP